MEELASGAQGSEVDGGDRGIPKFYQVVQRETANLQGMALDLIFLFFFLMRFFGVLFEESEWKPSYVQCEFKQLQVFRGNVFVTMEKVNWINRLSITIFTVDFQQFRKCSSALVGRSTLCLNIPIPKLVGFLPRGHMRYLQIPAV